ncbi:AAA family ATPase [Paenibacillus alginolyticus]|uniref:AAA family ATPase n=1 Tax=Paenibacillus alginolyticus TaxID=59839 RepID=UPI000685C74B|nr:AAA family ATPase [Paenibacillus alginolyticus]MCY9669054.1 AAA family ATPase [Paenibacillus alginolyticus]
MFTSLRVENYRGLKEVFIPMSSFVCIIGENNAGKSTTLLAISLFITGSKLTSNDFFNSSKPIRVEVEIKLNEHQLVLLTPEEKAIIETLIQNGRLKLIRRYDSSDTVGSLCIREKAPIDKRYDMKKLEEQLKGKSGYAVEELMLSIFPEHASDWTGLTTQKSAKEVTLKLISHLSNEQLVETDKPLAANVVSIVKKILPEPILIPAVKDITDDVKTKESATFGKLLAILMNLIEGAEEVKQIVESFNKLKGLLNKIVSEDGTVLDNRLKQVVNIESSINTYLRENFPKAKLEFQIPPPQLRQVFSTAQIMVDDGVIGDIESKGDGLKRAVMFSILRSYVELKRQESNIQLSVKNVRQQYIFLFEEPELFLHPQSQKILFEALSKLSSGHQIVATTHSPAFFSPTSTGVFVKMSKDYIAGSKPISKAIFIDLHNDMSKKDFFQILCYENNAAAFFAQKVLLVEGDSDIYFFKHISKVLNNEWDFDNKGIPVIKLNGKGNVARFKEFFGYFGIKVYCILDLDVLIGGFAKLEAAATTTEIRASMLEVIDRIIDQENVIIPLGKEKIVRLVQSYTWRDRYTQFMRYVTKVSAGELLSDEERMELEYLFPEEKNEGRKLVLQRGFDALPSKLDTIIALYAENTYVLSQGAVENYYPAGVQGGDKPTRAMQVCQLLNTRDEINQVCPSLEINGETTTEFEHIFKRIFS